jgi:SAM-dependent methyltransferase
VNDECRMTNVEGRTKHEAKRRRDRAYQAPATSHLGRHSGGSSERSPPNAPTGLWQLNVGVLYYMGSGFLCSVEGAGRVAPTAQRATEMDEREILPNREELQERCRALYGDIRKHGWRVRMTHRFGYFGGDAWYEATVDRLVTEHCTWVDVGGGKSVFPHNDRLSEALSRRCALLVGVDPSDNIESNPYVHERAKCMIEDYKSERKFDLVTLRMVAEHIADPKAVIESLGRLIKPGGKVVVYTPNRWSLISIAAAIIPYQLHQPITHVLWGTREEDVFPTVYKMNTRNCLRRLFDDGGFRETAFAYLDNCSAFQRWRVSCFLELSAWWILQRLALKYPNNNLLGVYEKV